MHAGWTGALTAVHWCSDHTGHVDEKGPEWLKNWSSWSPEDPALAILRPGL